MERIETVARRPSPVRRRPKLDPVSVCQAIHDAPDGLVRLVRRGVGAVHHACLLNRLPAGVGAAKAVHADLKEKFSGINIVIENVADNGLLCYSHFCNIPFNKCNLVLYYYYTQIRL